MTPDYYYRQVLGYWARIAGPMFPRLQGKIVEALAEPEITETDYLKLVAEVNRAGGPKIGKPGKPLREAEKPKAKRGATINQRMAAMLTKDPTLASLSARQWVEKLGDGTEAAVKQTHTWKVLIMPGRAYAKLNRGAVATDRRRKQRPT